MPVVLALAGLALLAAAYAQPAEDTPETQAAVRALEITNRTLNRWFVLVIIAVVVAIVVAAWRIWVYGTRLSEVDGLRAAWDKRFSDLSDELLRTKRKLTEYDSAMGDTRADIARIQQASSSVLTGADITRLDNDLAVVRTRLDEIDAKVDGFSHRLDTVDTHEKDAAAALADVARVRTAAETAVARAEQALQRSQALAFLQAGDDGFAARDYTAAVAAYARWFQAMKDQPVEDERLLFRVLHNRATANLRLGRPDAVLADASRLAGLKELGSKAAGAAHLLSALARLNQNLVDEALDAFADAVRADAYVKVIVARDEDVRSWLARNSKQARAVGRRLNRLIAPEKVVPGIAKPELAAGASKHVGKHRVRR